MAPKVWGKQANKCIISESHNFSLNQDYYKSLTADNLGNENKLTLGCGHVAIATIDLHIVTSYFWYT